MMRMSDSLRQTNDHYDKIKGSRKNNVETLQC